MDSFDVDAWRGGGRGGERGSEREKHKQAAAQKEFDEFRTSTLAEMEKAKAKLEVSRAPRIIQLGYENAHPHSPPLGPPFDTARPLTDACRWIARSWTV